MPDGEAPDGAGVDSAAEAPWHDATPYDGRSTSTAYPVAWFAGVAGWLLVVAAWSLTHLPFRGLRPPGRRYLPYPWLEGWYRWDANWYAAIAERGYSYRGPHHQASVAFYPAYPAVMRVLGRPFGNVVAAGSVVTTISGGAAAYLLYRWAARSGDRKAAAWTVGLLLLYPFAFFLTWTVYSDALFLALALAAFVSLETDHPVLAALGGAAAAATRPVGLALAACLVLRAWQRHRSTGGLRAWWVTAASAGGWAAFSAYQWFQFGTPWAGPSTEDAPGWGHGLAWRTVLKIPALHALAHPALDVDHVRIVLGAAVALAVLGLLPAVYRRFGAGYALYCVLVVGVPLAVSPDFIGLGRYALAAFPCFAVVGGILSRRPRAGTAVLTLSGVGLTLLTSWFARGAYLS